MSVHECGAYVTMSVEKNIPRKISNETSIASIPKRSYSSTDDVNSHTERRALDLSFKTRRRLEILSLVLAVTVVLGLFSIPIIMHIKHQVDNDTNGITDCNLSWSILPSTKFNKGCLAETYRGEVCKNFLHTWQNCAIGKAQGLLVNKTRNESFEENSIKNFLDNSSPSCRRVALPLLCQYAFPLCHSSDIYLPSREYCYYTTRFACAKEFKNFSISFALNCSNFPPKSYPTDDRGQMNYPIARLSNTQTINCSYAFYKHNNSCLPRCDRFNQDSRSNSLMLDVISIWTGWFGLIVGISVLALSAFKYKTMFTFPSVFLVYLTLSFCMIEVFIVVTFFDRSGLYCSSDDLSHSFQNPTLFCRLSGIALHYGLVNTALWWFFHVSSIFYKLMFPFMAMKTGKYEKYIHAVLLLLGLVLPLPAVIYTLVKSKYIVELHPPLLCVPFNQDVWYYSTTLVLNVLVALGVCMFLPMIWVVHKCWIIRYYKLLTILKEYFKVNEVLSTVTYLLRIISTQHQGIFKHRAKGGGIALSAAEKKIIFVLCYYVLFAVITLFYIQTLTENEGKYFNALQEYFRCEYFGEGNNCQSDYEKYAYPYSRAACYLVMSMIPFANLVFLINWTKTRSYILNIKSRLCSDKEGYESDKDSFHSALSPHPDSTDINYHGEDDEYKD